MSRRVDQHGSHHLDAAQLAAVAAGAPGAMARFLAWLGYFGGDERPALAAEWAEARGVGRADAAEDMQAFVLGVDEEGGK